MLFFLYIVTKLCVLTDSFILSVFFCQKKVATFLKLVYIAFN